MACGSVGGHPAQRRLQGCGSAHRRRPGSDQDRRPNRQAATRPAIAMRLAEKIVAGSGTT